MRGSSKHGQRGAGKHDRNPTLSLEISLSRPNEPLPRPPTDIASITNPMSQCPPTKLYKYASRASSEMTHAIAEQDPGSDRANGVLPLPSPGSFVWPWDFRLPRLNVGVLATVFLAHILNPIALPLCLWLWGVRGTHNLRLLILPGDSFARVVQFFVFEFVIPIAMVSCFALFFCLRDEMEAHGFRPLEAAMPLALCAIHKLMVSAKYALLPRSQFEWFMHVATPQEADNFNLHIQLGSAWLNPSSIKVEDELLAAEARMSANLSLGERSARFDVDLKDKANAAKWRLLVGESAWQAALESTEAANADLVEISAHSLCHSLIMSSSQRGDLPRPLIVSFNIFAALLHGLMPGLSRSIGNDHNVAGNGGPKQSLLVACYLIASVPMFAVLLTFLSVGVSNMRRRQLMMRRLGKLIAIRGTTLRLPNGDMVEPHSRYPQIQDTPLAMQSWLLCRLVLHEYGAGVATRLAFYLAISMIWVVMLLIWLLSILIRNHENPEILKYNFVTHVAMFDSMLIGGFVVLTIAAGAAANNTCSEHRLLLAHRQVQLRVSSRKNDAQEARQREEIDDMCMAGSTLIELLNTYRPARVLVFEASDRLLFSVFTVFASACVIFFESVYIG